MLRPSTVHRSPSNGLPCAGLRDVVGRRLRGVGEHEPAATVIVRDGEVMRRRRPCSSSRAGRARAASSPAEREGEHARDRVVPLGLVELEAVPADVLEPAPVAAAGEERAAAQARVARAAGAIMLLEEPEERRALLLDQRPVEPAELVVLAVGVVVAALRAADLVAARRTSARPARRSRIAAKFLSCRGRGARRSPGRRSRPRRRSSSSGCRRSPSRLPSPLASLCFSL